MENYLGKTLEGAAAIQKLWMDSASKMTGVLTQFSPVSPPIEEARKLRDGMLKMLGESCEEFLRTPQFMEAMKNTLNVALDLRNFQRNGMDAIHEHLQTPDKDDIDGVLLAIRHVERRLLDRLEDLDESITCLNKRLEAVEPAVNSKRESPVGKRQAVRRQKRTTVAKHSSKRTKK